MQERTHHPSGPLGLAIALAATAGFVDAHIYVNVTPVFVANMSGNLIHLGISLGEGDWFPALATVLALGAFTGVYGDFMSALIIIPDQRMWTPMVWLYQIHNSPHQAIVSASPCRSAIPTLLVFLFAQNVVMRGS